MIKFENKACCPVVRGDTLISGHLEGFLSRGWTWHSIELGALWPDSVPATLVHRAWEVVIHWRQRLFHLLWTQSRSIFACGGFTKASFIFYPIGKLEVIMVSEAKMLVCGGVRVPLNEFTSFIQSCFPQKARGELPGCWHAPGSVTLCCSLLRTDWFLLVAQTC